MSDVPNASGRFLFRIDPQIHRLLKSSASALGVSLNRYCAAKLSAPIDPDAALMAAPVVERAAKIFGDRLIGVVAFGSWARGDATTDSDVDLLVVVDREIELSRDLYRDWDHSPLSWDGHAVEPHFVHLPDRDNELAGTWAEVAVDGIVVFERGWALSRRLSAIRRKIAEGHLVRRSAHGQPYWMSVS